MKRIIIFYFLFSAIALAEEVEDPDRGAVFIEAKPISKPTPRYPGVELQLGKEGWVILSYVVSKEGNVIDPIVEDSSGNKRFEKAALGSARESKYEPAKINGKPAEQCFTKTRYKFDIKGGRPGASRAFVRRYRQIAKLIESGSLSEAVIELKKLKERERWNLYEDAWFWLLQSQYNMAVDDKKALYESLLKAVAYEGEYLHKSMYIYALKNLFQSEIRFSYFSDALKTFSKLDKLIKNKESIVNLAEAVEKIETHLESDKAIAVNGMVGEVGFWRYELNRNQFSYQNAKDVIDRFELRCNRKRQVFKFSLEKSWKVPKSWGKCTVYVYGQEGASFSIVEYPS